MGYYNTLHFTVANSLERVITTLIAVVAVVLDLIILWGIFRKIQRKHAEFHRSLIICVLNRVIIKDLPSHFFLFPPSGWTASANTATRRSWTLNDKSRLSRANEPVILSSDSILQPSCEWKDSCYFIILPIILLICSSEVNILFLMSYMLQPRNVFSHLTTLCTTKPFQRKQSTSSTI